jgi:putative acetyltransferase
MWEEDVMIRLFEFKDVDRIMEIWLEGNVNAHSFIEESYWKNNYKSVRAILPNAEVYVYEVGNEILGFIGMDADYIAGIFVAEGHQGQGIGHQLVDAMKRKKRLSLHVYEKNNGAVVFYKKEGFCIENYLTEKETGENEYLMVYNAG